MGCLYREDTDLFVGISHLAALKPQELSFKHQQPPELQLFVRSVSQS